MKCSCLENYKCKICGGCYACEHKAILRKKKNSWYWICPNKTKHQVDCNGKIKIL